MKQSRKAAKVAYQRLKELVKFGKFAEVEDTPTVCSINTEVADEHVAPKPKFQFTFEEIEPPQTGPVDTEPPSESDPEDSNNALLPRKRKRRDPKPGVLITDPVHKKSTVIEPGSMAQNKQGTFTESSPVIQDIPSPIPEPIPMDQDSQSPIVEEEVIPSEGAQALGSSFEIPELDFPKAKASCLNLN
ncbi:unnamed protein product [Lactuca virosa]|uniref:Uncharacterized protein n=1 Tax=Lactuca virosa TaxID=75947 RepID=A0AAU9PHE0_9ASTR|nr:unnamed protein product [Lactuca virosa]